MQVLSPLSYAALFEFAPLGCFVLARDGTIRAANRAGTALLGAAGRCLAGVCLRSFVAAGSLAAYDAMLEQASAGPMSVARELEMSWPSGAACWARMDALAIPDTNECGVSLVDITERKRAEESLLVSYLALEQRVRERTEELERAARLHQLGELCAGLAHEVNQPLAAIVYTLAGAARHARGGALGDAKAAEAIGEAIAHAHRAAGILTRVRALATRHEPSRAPLAIGEVIEDAIAISRVAAAANGIHLAAELRAALPPVLADRVQVEQVLLNLLANGIDAAAAAGGRRRAVTVEAAAIDSDTVEVAVEDSGAGLTPAERARMFAPFYTTKEGGMGLGLAICQRIVEEHGGAIRAEPAAGGGLRVAFTLPAGGP